MIYPHLASESQAIAVIHTDQESPNVADNIAIDPDAKPETVDPAATELTGGPLPPRSVSTQSSLVENYVPLNQLLLFEGDLPEIRDMPILAFDGRLVSFEGLAIERDVYVKWFRDGIGKCSGSDQTFEVVAGAEDLFCYKDPE